MLVIPAIDIIGGRCVRLRQGKAGKVEIFSNDPPFVARTWERLGAELIHLVDLDGAFKGKMQNFPLIKAVVKAVKIPVQLGGGLRDSREIARAFKAGVNRVVLGTRAFESPDWVRNLVKKYGKKILVAADNYNGNLAVRGWRRKVDVKIFDFIREMKRLGVKNFVFTDVLRDGMMKGPNIDMIKEILTKLKVKLIASGGVTTKEDLKKIKKLEKKGLVGVIIGRALYTGALKLDEAIEIGGR